jgi:GcrA cell cycle regulator
MQSNWEEAHSRSLREFVEKGMSFAQAAKALNERFGTAYSRNAAIGRARRMGLSGQNPAGGEEGRHAPTLASRPPDLRRLNKLRAEKLAAKHVTTKSAATGRLAGSLPKTAAKLSTLERAAVLQLRCVAITPRHLRLADLEDGDCRYPYGGDAEGEPITFCGHPRREGSSYCTSHVHLTTAPELRERVSPKASLRLVEAA